MNDFLGNKLKIGDKVVFIEQWRSSSNLCKGEVIGFTSTFVVLDSCKKSPDKIIKIK